MQIRPIPLLTGAHHFNEVVFDAVFVPDEMVLGELGAGWQQVTGELAFERSGPERFLSTFPLLRALLGELVASGSAPERELGELVSRLWTLRRMSLAVAGSLESGEAPELAAAVVKDLGTRYENEIVDAARVLVATPPDPGAAGGLRPAAGRRRAACTRFHPAGRHQRGAARHRRARHGSAMTESTTSELAELAESVFGAAAARTDGAAATAPPPASTTPLWKTLEDTGLARLTLPEEAGGSEGTFADSAVLLAAAGAHAARVPLVETDLLAGWLLHATGIALPSRSAHRRAPRSWTSTAAGRCAARCGGCRGPAPPPGWPC